MLPPILEVVPIQCLAPNHPWWHPPVGIFIAIAGSLGVVLVLVRDIRKMSRWEKVIWIAAIAVLTISELRTIIASGQDAEKQKVYDECILEQNFQTIESESQHQFSSTMDGVNKVFAKTEEAADTATNAVNQITGGKAFAYLIPSTVVLPGYVQMNAFSTNIKNNGGQILTEVSVSLARVVKEGEDGQWAGSRMDSGLMSPVPVGSLAPHESRLTPTIYIDPKTFVDHEAHYRAVVYAQNGQILEDIYLRPAKGGIGWAYRLKIERPLNGKEVLLKSIDWTEPEIDSLGTTAQRQ
jgi:hypothetical protein